MIKRSDLQGQNRTGQQLGGNLVTSLGEQYDLVNWDYAVVERLNRNDLSSSLIPFNLGKALSDPVAKDNLLLQQGDTVTVFAAADIRVPLAKRQVFVHVEGEVRTPGIYQLGQGETLINLIQKAGGFTVGCLRLWDRILPRVSP